MLAPVRVRALDRPKRLSLLKRDREGVASTVGTIMALLVFLAFMALITNSYVPAWMNDNEREHMNTVIDQFGQLKGKVDSMIVEMEIKGTSVTKMYAPITLGSAGVPLFAVPTAGILDYIPEGSNSSGIAVKYWNDTASAIDNTVGGGKVEIYVPNRYYVQQWVTYENGAIMIKQEDGQTLRAFPSLSFSGETGSLSVSFTQIDLIGANQSMAGTDPIGFNLDLLYIEAKTYHVEDGTLTLSFNTTYQAAWTEYLVKTLTESGLTNETADPDYKLDGTTTTADIVLTLNHVGSVNYNRALVTMSVLS